jgi:hypothetical protein
VRMMLAASQGSSDDAILKMGLGALYSPGKVLAKGTTVSFGSDKKDLGQAVAGLVTN